VHCHEAHCRHGFARLHCHEAHRWHGFAPLHCHEAHCWSGFAPLQCQESCRRPPIVSIRERAGRRRHGFASE
jgi:hypothetical protein